MVPIILSDQAHKPEIRHGTIEIDEDMCQKVIAIFIDRTYTSSLNKGGNFTNVFLFLNYI